MLLLSTAAAMQVSYLVNAEVLANVDHPATESSSCTRLVADVVSVEVRVAQIVLFTLLHTLERYVVLVEGQQGLEEGVHITHHLLASIPAQILQGEMSGASASLGLHMAKTQWACTWPSQSSAAVTANGPEHIMLTELHL